MRAADRQFVSDTSFELASIQSATKVMEDLYARYRAGGDATDSVAEAEAKAACARVLSYVAARYGLVLYASEIKR